MEFCLKENLQRFDDSEARAPKVDKALLTVSNLSSGLYDSEA